jgi:hypothetical protein
VTEFQERALATSMLRSHLAARLDDAAFAAACAEACVDEFRLQRPLEVPADGNDKLLIVPQAYWVIRDDDLDATSAFWQAAAAFAASDRFLHLSASAVVALLAAAFSVYRNIRAKGALVQIDQCRVLTALRRLGKPATPAEVAATLDVALSEAEGTLHSLRSVRRSDGVVMSVVAEDPEGRWTCSGI